MDKNKAIIQYLSNCPEIANNPLFFNYANAEDNNKQLVTTSVDKALEPKYIDGSVLRRFTFTIIDFRSVIYQALVADQSTYPNENVDDFMGVQSIIDWIETQNNNKSYPDFGDKCVIDSIQALTDTPVLNGVDSNSIAKYSIAIQVIYLDTSDRVWG